MERREAYPTDTQHIVNLSGYVWAARHLPELGGMIVLDAACGTGYGSEYLSTQARKVVGIDLSSEVVTRCRAHYSDLRISFVPMDGCALAFADGSFDCILSQDTVEHIQMDHQFVSELARVLKPTGTLIIFTPHGKGCRYQPADPYHVREYLPEEFHALLAPHFTQIRWFGRRQGHRLRQAERSMDAVRQYDPLGVRNVVPRPVRHWIGGLISRVRGGPTLSQITADDIDYQEGYAADTNLIGVCMK